LFSEAKILWLPARLARLNLGKSVLQKNIQKIAGEVAIVSPKSEQTIRTHLALANPISVGILFITTVVGVYVIYIGKEVVLPVTLAIVLKLLLKPIMDFFQFKLRFPAPVAALLLIAGLFSAVGAVGLTISGPASAWISKVPTVLPSIKEKLVVLRQPIDYLQSTFKEFEEVATLPNNPEVPTVAVKDTTRVVSKLAWGVVATITIIFTTMIVLFFLLAAGDRLLKGLIEVLPSFSDKRQAVDIATEIQRQIGGYLLTISLMNSIVGLLTGLAMWWCGLGDPVLWGSAAFALNYIPILGPVAGVGSPYGTSMPGAGAVHHIRSSHFTHKWRLRFLYNL